MRAYLLILATALAARLPRYRAAQSAKPTGEPPPGQPEGGPAGEFVCFVYHRFGDSRAPSTSVAVDVFRAQLAHLHEDGYTVLTLGNALARLDEARLPPKSVVLTVDDGYHTFWTAGWPVLQEFGFPATLFINTISVGKPGYLTWDQLAALAAAGVEIGNHSHSHPYFVDLPPAEILPSFIDDVEKAQSTIAERLGFRPALLSYPFGEYTPAMEAAARDLGFTAATAQFSGVVSPASNRFALPRFPMGGPYATLDGFRSKSRMHALRVRQQQPASPVIWGTDPPALRLELAEPERLNLRALQCFVAGRRTCEVTWDPADPTRVTMDVTEPLRARRTLCTITAPGRAGGWHWYSHVWIRPGIPE
jgi:peptidoglycan/xylan/chitin deacetylase (PgdA/CDA1 family)